MLAFSSIATSKCGVRGLPLGAITAIGSIATNGDEHVRCNRCGFGACDVRIAGCGCTLHARCTQLNSSEPLRTCPQCARHTTGLILLPLSFREIDETRRTTAALFNNGQNNRKRKSCVFIHTDTYVNDTSSISSGNDKKPEEKACESDLRTGRWTTEEMTYCDQLIDKFQAGSLPIKEGIKLNDFLANMLRSKQSRLTKKMKNAKLSSKTFKKALGYLLPGEARDFSLVEESFFHSIQDHQERAEMKFHMQKEWRELFSTFCISVSQPLDADAWLTSVEEMDRRASTVKDASLMARRKLMMGFALSQDSHNCERGVFIEKTEMEVLTEQNSEPLYPNAMNVLNSNDTDEFLSLLTDDTPCQDSHSSGIDEFECNAELNGKSSLLHSAPFLNKVVAYMTRHNVPFEHVDCWVPSFVPDKNGETKCRLCFAGGATTETRLPPDEKRQTERISLEDQFHMLAFGDYSQKFSFDVGCGLPGRVYQSGIPTWEQNVYNAPNTHFERAGGAAQWGIKTVAGIPVPSPNVGRIVVVFYSCYDRVKDHELVGKLSDELTRLMPSPKWTLVVDMDYPSTSNRDAVPTAATSIANETQAMTPTVSASSGRDSRIDEIVSLIGEHMPSDPSSSLAKYLPGFMSLRLLLLRPSHTFDEDHLVRTILGSYSSYAGSGRSMEDIAIMLVLDFMFLRQTLYPKAPFVAARSSKPAASGCHSNFSLYGMTSQAGKYSYTSSPTLTPIVSSNNVTDTFSIVST